MECVPNQQSRQPAPQKSDFCTEQTNVLCPFQPLQYFIPDSDQIWRYDTSPPSLTFTFDLDLIRHADVNLFATEESIQFPPAHI